MISKQKTKDSGIEWVGTIPTDWMIHPLYCYFSERTNKNTFGRENNLLSLSYGNIIPKDINSDEGLLPKSFNTYNIVEPGDIIIRPTDLQNDKHSLRTGLVKEHGIITSAYIALKPNHSAINTAYYQYLLYAYDTIKVFYNMGNGVRQGLNFSEFSQLMVLEPPYYEQNMITEFLNCKCTEIDAVAADIESQIEILEQYKRSVITEAVTKGLDPDVKMKDSGIEWIGLIPATWKIEKLKNCCDFPPKTFNKPKTKETEIEYTPMEYIKNGYFISRTEEYKNLSTSLTQYNEGDIVLAKVTPCFENGNIAIMTNIHNGYGLGSSELFVVRATNILDKFMFYWLQNDYFKSKAISTMTGTGGLKRVSSYFIANSKVPFPPLHEQHSIAHYLDNKCIEIDTIIADKQAQLDTLAEYKKSLIYEYVTGKKEVPVT